MARKASVNGKPILPARLVACKNPHHFGVHLERETCIEARKV